MFRTSPLPASHTFQIAHQPPPSPRAVCNNIPVSLYSRFEAWPSRSPCYSSEYISTPTYLGAEDFSCPESPISASAKLKLDRDGNKVESFFWGGIGR